MGIAIGNAIGVPFGGGEYAPTNLAVSVKSATSAYLSWTNSGWQGDGIRLYSSTDGTNYTQVGSDLPVDTTSYTHNSIDTGTNRYWKVCYFKGTKEGTFSSVVQLDWFTMQCTTTGAATLTLYRVNCVAGDGITIFWGDGSSNSYTSANNGTTKTHAYSGAGTWTVKIANPLNISYIQLSDTKLTNFNTNQFLKCGDNLTGIYLDNLGTGRIVNSSDLAHLKLSSTLYLYFYQTGTYNINSYHFRNYKLNNNLTLNFTTSGTFTINSDHFKNYTLNDTLYIILSAAGTYNINTSHFKNYTLASTYTIHLNTANLTKTISRSDFTLYRVPTVTITMGLTQSEVDTILLGIYDAFPSKTNAGGKINLNGAGNEAPSGTYASQCPPMTGKEAAYELLNDSCNASDKHWATINVVGGLP